MQLCFFEDDKANHFHPLSLTRPLDDLRLGILTVREKWMQALNIEKVARISKNYLKTIFPNDELSANTSSYWINSRFLPSKGLVEQIHSLKEHSVIVQNQVIVAAKINGSRSADFINSGAADFSGLKQVKTEGLSPLHHLWDLLNLNAEEIKNDLRYFKLKPAEHILSRQDLYFSNTENLFIGENVRIEPNCTFIADKGPVVLMDGAAVEAGSILSGPVCIGEKATVKSGTRISDGTTIGPVCKVGGEVMNCIFHSYSNKAHDGFTGNSIFGQWVNLGADTNTSNLKNNYSTVRITDWHSGTEIETGQQFLGTIMGDHSKTSINTMLNTGTVCGVSSNIFMPGFPPKFIPSFAWVGSEEYGVYRFDKAIETMQAMMSRRDVELTDDYQAMMKHLFNQKEH